MTSTYTTGSDLLINELFETVQGEAVWTGTPSVFIRLQGCNVGCSFCDTKFSWPITPEKECSTAAMVSKQADDSTYAKMSTAQLVGFIRRQYQARHIVITGGEPCMYDLTDLTSALIEGGRTVQIETSGTEPIRCHPQTWVTVSPKIGMAGGKQVLPEAITRADEIKVPVGRPADIARFTAMWNPVKDSLPQTLVWLQPLSCSQKATELCIQTATACGWRLSLQTHKFIGVR